jgi:hypothetical protein
MKADGQLTGICIYKPNTIEFNITNSLINKLPKNSYYHKLRELSVKKYGYLMIINSQRTFLISNKSKEDLKRWSWILTSIFKGCLNKKIENCNYEILINLYMEEFMEKINKQIKNINSPIIFLCFESICDHRKCLKGILHRDMTINYPKSRFIFLGMNVLENETYTFIPHYKCINQNIFEQPMTWIDKNMTGEKVEKILQLYSKYYVKNIQKFIDLSKPSIINYQKDLEGFILYALDTSIKIKDETFCNAFKQKKENISNYLIPYYPFYQKLQIFDNFFDDIINNIKKLNIYNKEIFITEFEKKGFQLYFLGPIHKSFSYGILDYMNIINKLQQNVLYNNDKLLNQYIQKFLDKYINSIINNPSHWKHCFFSCCELLHTIIETV